jgi:two-component system chemotaxis response regulator CheB
MSEDRDAHQLGRADLAQRDNGASGFSCPECQGNLWELSEGELIQYQCRVGHTLSVDSLVAVQNTAIEAMLWTALNALQERAAFLRRLGRRRAHDPAVDDNDRFEELAATADRQAEFVQQALQGAIKALG